MKCRGIGVNRNSHDKKQSDWLIFHHSFSSPNNITISLAIEMKFDDSTCGDQFKILRKKKLKKKAI